jgi:two-component system NarL family sensor kinase
MRKTICIVVVFISFTATYCQYEKKDSLLRSLSSAKDDTAKVNLLLSIANLYEANDQDSSIYYLEAVKQLSAGLKYKKGLYRYYERSAIVSFTQGKYDLAMKQSNDALRLARELKDSSFVITMLNNIGIVYAYLGKFEEQLDYTLQVKNAAEAIKDSSKFSGLYHNLANCYYNLHQYRKSNEYALLSVRIHTEYRKKNDYINRVYATLAQNYDAMQITDSALYYYEKAVKESIAVNDKYAEASIYGYLCDLYASLNRFDDMLNVAEKSLLLSRELQSGQMVASSLYYAAYANLFNNNMEKARKDIREALEIATKDTLRDELKYSYGVLSYIAARDGDYVTTVRARRKADSIREAILNEKVIESTTELEKKYESEKKDKQIILQKTQLQRRRTLNYVVIGSGIILLIISLLSYRNYRQKQTIQQRRITELETEKQLTAAEAVVKGEEQERTRLAKDLHDGLGGMLSGIKYSFQTMKGNLVMTPENHQAFERSMDMLDSSIKEMRRVAHNMMPETLVKFGLDTALKDFCNEINQVGALKVNYQSIGLEGAAIDQTTAITLYRIVQELLNNAMKHAAARNVIVQVSKTDNVISVTVEDDGKGFDTSILSQSKGIGWSNIQNRVEFLKGKLDVNSQSEKGTSVLIEFPV